MSGENDFVDRQMTDIVSKMESLSRNIFIEQVNVNQNAEAYLTMPQEGLEKMTADELGVGEAVLAQYGLAVQRKINRAKVLRNWAVKCLDKMIAKRYDAFDKFMKHEIRRMSITYDNEYAKRLDQIVMDQDGIIDELDYITQAVHGLAGAFANLARIRKASPYRGE